LTNNPYIVIFDLAIRDSLNSTKGIKMNTSCPFCRNIEIEKIGIINAEKYSLHFGKDEYSLYEFKCESCKKHFFLETIDCSNLE